MCSDLRKLIKTARQAGWTVEMTRNSHWKFLPPDPALPPIIEAGSGSDVRGVKNTRARLRRCGLSV